MACAPPFTARVWLEQAKAEKVVPGSKTRSHLVRLSLEPGFPSGRVVQAYLEPTVDESREAFSWGTPDLDALRTYPLPLGPIPCGGAGMLLSHRHTCFPVTP